MDMPKNNTENTPDLIDRRAFYQHLNDIQFTQRGVDDAYCDFMNEVMDLLTQFPSCNTEGVEPVLEEGATLVHCSYSNGTGGYERRPYLDWKCPSCGYFVGELYSGNGRWHIQGERSYCSRCGQKIDWTKPKAEEKERYERRKESERNEWERKHGMPLDNMNAHRREKYGIR